MRADFSSDARQQFVSGFVTWTYTAEWDLSYHDFSGADFATGEGEQWRHGLGGGASPQEVGLPSGLFYTGYDPRLKRSVIPPGGGAPVVIVPLGWHTEGGAEMIPVGSTDEELWHSKLVFGTAYDFKLNIDCLLGVVDLYMAPHGSTLQSIGAFKLRRLTPTGAPYRIDYLAWWYNDADGVDRDNSGHDYLRVDDFKADHVSDPDVKHCGDVDQSTDDPDSADLTLLAQILNGVHTPTAAQLQLADVDRSMGSQEPTFADFLRLANYIDHHSVALICPGAP